MVDIKEGETIDVTVESVGKKGDGIAKIDNKIIFVPNATEGETLKVKVTRVLEHVAFAEKA